MFNCQFQATYTSCLKQAANVVNWKTNEKVHDDNSNKYDETDPDELSDAMVGDNVIVELRRKVKFAKHHGKCGDERGEGVSVSIYIKNQMKTESKCNERARKKKQE